MLKELITEFERYQNLAEEALAPLNDATFFARPGAQVNPLGLIVKHVAGNLRSRWTDFLTTDGEKPDRNRDGEFRILDGDTRDNLMAAWRRGFDAVYATLGALSESDLDKVITIRGEPHTVRQAALRSFGHTAYHVGQILYVCRLLNPEGKWLTIAPGESQTHRASYLPKPGGK